MLRGRESCSGRGNAVGNKKARILDSTRQWDIKVEMSRRLKDVELDLWGMARAQDIWESTAHMRCSSPENG